jgi:lysozyme
MVGKDGKFIKGASNKALAYSLQTIHTVEDANMALIQDLKPFQLQIERKIKITLTEEQNAALVSFFYNTGGSSTLCNLINSKDKGLYDW